MKRIYIEINTIKHQNFYVSNDLISFECSENMRDAKISLNPGVIEQSATIVIYDRDNNFKNASIYNTEDIFKGATVAIHATETVNNGFFDEILGTYLISEIKFDGDSETVTLNCSDITSQLNNVVVNEYPLEQRNAHQLLSIVFNDFLNGAFWQYMSTEVENICKNTIVPNSYMNNTNAREILDMVCGLCMLTIYCKNNVFYVGFCV